MEVVVEDVEDVENVDAPGPSKVAPQPRQKRSKSKTAKNPTKRAKPCDDSDPEWELCLKRSVKWETYIININILGCNAATFSSCTL